MSASKAQTKVGGFKKPEVRLFEGKWDISGSDIGGEVSPIRCVSFFLISSGLDSSERKTLPEMLAVLEW